MDVDTATLQAQARNICENHVGAMGTFEVSGADGTYSNLVVRGSTRNGHVNKAFSHLGILQA
jgi:hypothetical protein